MKRLKTNRLKRFLPAASVVFSTALLSASAPWSTVAYAQDAAPAPTAQATAGSKVVLLPVINISGEKDDKQKADQVKRAEEELAKQFRERGFMLIPRETVDKALTDERIDLTDEEYHNRSSILKVGRATGADLAVFVLITDVDQRRVRAPLTGEEMVGKARTKIWVLSVADEKPLLNAVRHESQARSNLLPGFDSGARLIRNSVAGAVRDTLRPFFLNLPKR
ncbi:MAG: hypothetical protein SFU56_09840 [Capsulimonadales bacterium]|nr:hypothetical protein [Capsulimonadales bacterium]